MWGGGSIERCRLVDELVFYAGVVGRGGGRRSVGGGGVITIAVLRQRPGVGWGSGDLRGGE